MKFMFLNVIKELKERGLSKEGIGGETMNRQKSELQTASAIVSLARFLPDVEFSVSPPLIYFEIFLTYLRSEYLL